MGRPALAVTVDSNGRAVQLITAHLKSKPLTFPGGRFSARRGRTGPVRGVRTQPPRRRSSYVRAHATALLNGHGPDRAVVVLGDLNDEPAAATTQLLLGPPGSEIGTAGLDQPDAGDGERLWNLAPLSPEEQRSTRVHREQRQLIDHILASHAITGLLNPGDVTTAPNPHDDPVDQRRP